MVDDSAQHSIVAMYFIGLASAGSNSKSFDTLSDALKFARTTLNDYLKVEEKRNWNKFIGFATGAKNPFQFLSSMLSLLRDSQTEFLLNIPISMDASVKEAFILHLNRKLIKTLYMPLVYGKTQHSAAEAKSGFHFKTN